MAKTDEPSVAYKYDAGLKGLAVSARVRAWCGATSRIPRAGLSLRRFEERRRRCRLRAANRLVVAETPAGSIAAFPPPHRFLLGARGRGQPRLQLVSQGQRLVVLVRHPTGRARRRAGRRWGAAPRTPQQNFALYSARPGTWQQMPVFFYVSADARRSRPCDRRLAFTRQDRYKPLPGYQVMAQHFHTSPSPRMRAAGGLDVRLPDFDAMKARGHQYLRPDWSAAVAAASALAAAAVPSTDA